MCYVIDITKERIWTYWEHVIKMSENRIPLQAWTLTSAHKRRNKRPKESLNAQAYRMALEQLETGTRDRVHRKRMLSALCVNRGTGREHICKKCPNPSMLLVP